MRFKLLLSLFAAAIIILLMARSFFSTEQPAQPNQQKASVTVEPLQERTLDAVPFATVPAAVIAAINSLLLDDGEEPTLVLLYINGDNDLFEHIPDLVRDVHEGAVNPNIIVYMVLDWPGTDKDGKANSHLYRVDRKGVKDWDCNFRENYTCGVRYVEGQSVKPFPEDLGDPANLSKFVKDALAEVPYAKNVVLSLVGHGGGWSPNLLAGQPKGHDGQPGDGDKGLGGLLWDNYTADGKPGNSLSTLDLSQALSDTVVSTGRKIDLLYLDACLMGMWEVAHELKGSVNYLLASESWSWTSFAYNQHLGGILEGQSAAEIGAQWIENEAAILRRDIYPFTYSLLDLAQISTLTSSIDMLALDLKTALSTTMGSKEKIRNAFAASACFDSNADAIINRSDVNAGKGIDNYCDLHSFADELKKQFAGNSEVIKRAELVQSMVSTVVVSQSFACGAPGKYSPIPWCWSNLGGISLYTPFGQDDWKRGLYAQIQAGKQTQWDELLAAYWNAPNAPAAPTCPTEGCPLPAGPLVVENQVFLPVVTR